MKFELNKVYKARNGTQWKIICINKSGTILSINKEQNDYNHLWGNGNSLSDGEMPDDLIELVGDDFTPSPEPQISFTKQKYLAIKTCPQFSEDLLIRLFFEMVYEYTCSINSDTNVSGFSLKMGMITGELMRLHEEKWVKND